MKVHQSAVLTSNQREEAARLGRQLARLRVARRVKQSEAALRAGLSRNTAYRIEKGDPGLAVGQVLRYLDEIAPGRTLLDRVEARTKLLVTLSDGKPDDYSDHYRGEYGIEDTRQALHEAHRRGIHPFCITIDKEARDYLPHLYGTANWTLVDEIGRLPTKVADIYRRLTT